MFSVEYRVRYTDFYVDRRAQCRNKEENYDFKESECRLCGSAEDSPAHVLSGCDKTAELVSAFESKLSELSPMTHREYMAIPRDLRGLYMMSCCMPLYPVGVDHFDIFKRGESVRQSVDKNKISDCERAFKEYTDMAEIPTGSYAVYTDGSVFEEPGTRACGAGYAIWKDDELLEKGNRKLGDNVGCDQVLKKLVEKS